jgi:tetratricopeptide (TPR) repeat protein
MRNLSRILLVLALSPLMALAEEPKANDPEAARQYQHCIGLARSTAQEGWQEALAWSSMGGGEPAQHCAAVAMIAMRQFEEGAAKLEALAETSQSAPRLRAGMLAQAGQAWLLAKQPDRAFRAQSKALELVPGAPDLLIDRAQSLAEEKNYQAALQDLDEALKSAPDRSGVLTFRATAKRYLDDLRGARADVEEALKLDDHNQDAWLEDGIERNLATDLAGARASWQKVIALAPQSDAAEMARRDLELLDGGR